MPIQAKLLSALAALIVAFSSGWLVHGWKYDADRLSTEREQHDAYVKATAEANKTSAQLNGVLSTLEANKFVTVKETHHETTKTEYRCVLPDTGRVLFNRSTEGPYSIQPH